MTDSSDPSFPVLSEIVEHGNPVHGRATSSSVASAHPESGARVVHHEDDFDLPMLTDRIESIDAASAPVFGHDDDLPVLSDVILHEPVVHPAPEPAELPAHVAVSASHADGPRESWNEGGGHDHIAQDDGQHGISSAHDWVHDSGSEERVHVDTSAQHTHVPEVTHAQTPFYEAPLHEVPVHGSPAHEAAGHSVPHEEAGYHDVPLLDDRLWQAHEFDATGHETVQHEAEQHETAQHETAQHEALQHEVAPQPTFQPEAALFDAPVEEAVHDAQPHQDFLLHEPAQADVQHHAASADRQDPPVQQYAEPESAPVHTPATPLDADLIAARLRGRFASYLAGDGRAVIEARCREALSEHTTWLVGQITREVALELETQMTAWVHEAVSDELARRSADA